MSFKRILTHRDMRIAKVGKVRRPTPCVELMPAYMDCMAFGSHDSEIPPHLSREFHRSINEFYDRPKRKKLGIKTALSKYLLPPSVK